MLLVGLVAEVVVEVVKAMVVDDEGVSDGGYDGGRMEVMLEMVVVVAMEVMIGIGWMLWWRW